jgi:CBS domain-containing protein
MKVHEIMSSSPRCVRPDNTLVEAAGAMRHYDIGALPVCEGEQLVGMITDRDLVIRALADGRDPNNTEVREVMSAGVVTVFADQDVEAAVQLMEEKQLRRLVVLNREKRLVGILSLGDIAVSSSPAFSGIALKEVSQPS